MDLAPALWTSGFILLGLLPPVLGAIFVDAVDRVWPRVLPLLHGWLAATVVLGAVTVVGALAENAGLASEGFASALWQITGWTGAALAACGYAAVAARAGGKVLASWVGK